MNGRSAASQRKAARVETCRNRKRRQAEIIDRPVNRVSRWIRDSASGLLADIALGNGRAATGATGADHRIDAATAARCADNAEPRSASLRDRSRRGLQARSASACRTCARNPADARSASACETAASTARNQLTARGELALVWKFRPGQFSALTVSRRNAFRREIAPHFRIEVVNIERGGHADREAFDGSRAAAM